MKENMKEIKETMKEKDESNEFRKYTQIKKRFYKIYTNKRNIKVN
jgi:hypothetical protein